MDGGDLYDDAYRLTRFTVLGQISGVRQQSLWRCYSVTCTRATGPSPGKFRRTVVFSFLIGFTVAAECSFATNASTQDDLNRARRLRPSTCVIPFANNILFLVTPPAGGGGLTQCSNADDYVWVKSQASVLAPCSPYINYLHENTIFRIFTNI